MYIKFTLKILPVFFLLKTTASFSQNAVFTYEEAMRINFTGNEQQNTEHEKLTQSLLLNQPGLVEKNVAAPQNLSSEKSVAAPPANDDCANAIALTIDGADYVYTNVGATSAASDPAVATWPSCAGGPGNNVMHTVWFKFTVTGGPLNITVSSQGPALNNNAAIDKALYSVFSGFCGSLTQIGTTRAGTYGNYTSKSINLTNLANGTYYIMTDGLCSQTGNYRIRVNITPPGAPTLWYAAGAIPTLPTGANLTSGGQWGTYAATSELSPNCGAAGLGFSDWYQFVYNSATQNHIGITDHALQSGFYIGLYDAAGAQIICNKWGQADYASYTWDLSAQDGIAMHMPNISLKELGLVNGATYYVRIANTSTGAENVNTAVNKIYTVRLGNYMPAGDSYLDNVTLTLTQANTFSWLTGQTNRYSGHSMLSEPEQGNLAYDVDNSLMYKFNTATVTAVNVAFRNLTYYNHPGSTALGQVAVMTAPQGGTSVGSNMAFSGATFTLSLTGLTTNTDYWIVVDGGGGYGGTRLTFDISVSIPFSALPIELTAFSGRSDGTKNILNWSTATEKNNAYFIVEKSSDGILFEEFGRIKGAGDSFEKQEYTATDNEINSGVTYYRLKQTDFDETYSYSKVIAVSSDRKNSLNASVMPNPSESGSVNLNFTATNEGTAYLTMYSLTGQIIKSQEIRALKGSNSLDIEVIELSKGMYFFNLLMNDNLQKIKFIKE